MLLPCLPQSLHVLLYCFGYCAYHPAGIVICTQLARLWILIILIIPILTSVRTCKFAQTISNSYHHLLKRFFRLSGCQSRIFSISYYFLLLLNRCLCIFNSLSCHTGFSLNIILNQFLFFFIAEKMCFSTFQHRKLLLGSQSVQNTMGSDSVHFQAPPAFLCLMMSLGGTLRRFALFPYWMWLYVICWSIDRCSLCWLYSCAGCCMLQAIDDMEASCIYYVKVGTFDLLEQSKVCILIVTKIIIVMLTVQHNMIFIPSFM